MATFTKRPTGMTAFTTVWLGQIVSVLATNMTQFALTIWVFEKTGSATALGLMNVFFIALLVVHVPQPQTTEAGRQGQGGLLKESVYGFKYIFARPGLLGLQLVFLVGNLMAGIGFTVMYSWYYMEIVG
ncbi:MAG: hypothetical protein AAB382_04365, partial [Chloroflexota bacterium]